MARYVIGDIQGCFHEFQQLLAQMNFDPRHDQLWLVGDLIARGPQSLETLRYVKSLGNAAITVLGNHDLNFLAHRYGYGRIEAADQLDALLQAPDLDELWHWLSQQPLVHYDAAEDLLLVHAGMHPDFNISTLLQAASEVQHWLQQDPAQLFAQMYGNTPTRWSLQLSAPERWRFTINTCTRMRYCLPDGGLDFKEKGGLSQNPNLIPWFEFWQNLPHPTIFFGHWAALMGYSPVPQIFALDTGCVWGNMLTGYCIETQHRYSVSMLYSQK